MYHQIYERPNMKTIIFIAVIAFAAAEPDFYKFFENLDLNNILDKKQELEGFVNCVLDKGPCTELYDSYKDIFAAAVKEECHKCTPYQRHLFWLFLQGLKMKLPGHYLNFRQKYDPENKHFDALELKLQHKAPAF